MTTNNGTEIVNTVKAAIVTMANERGISLLSEFGTVAEFTKWVMAITLRMLLDSGLSQRDALLMVLGESTFRTLAESVWTELAAK